MSTKESNCPRLAHLARLTKGREVRYLFLREIEPRLYAWMQEGEDGAEEKTPVIASTLEEAIRLAYKQWKMDNFRLVHCGFRYTLPERDEHGINALFWQMALAYSSPNGVYFDADLGNNCFVNYASDEARAVWRRLKAQGRA